MWSIIVAAGWPIWPLLFASVLALAIIGERIYALQAKKVLPAGLLDEVAGVVRSQRVTPQILSHLETHSALGRILAAGLRQAKAGPETVREALEEAGRQEVHALERFLQTLGTIATVSPLLGLLGTVIGMVEIFGALSPQGADPAQLAQGISVALYNTAMGLIVAIPSLVFYRFFKSRVASLTLEMERQAARLVDLLRVARG